MTAAVFHRRRRRFHRQPFHRPAAGRPQRRSGHALRQFFLRPRVALRPSRARPAAARGRGDVKDLPALERAMAGHDTVIHLASNPDIARAATEPDIDFREGTFLTQQVVEAMRSTASRACCMPPAAASTATSASRGRGRLRADDAGLDLRRQQAGRRGADRLLLRDVRSSRPAPSASATWWAPRQTHGVGFDFVRRLHDASGPAAHSGRRLAEQVLHPRRGRGERGAAGAPASRQRTFRSTTSPPATTSP